MDLVITTESGYSFKIKANLQDTIHNIKENIRKIPEIDAQDKSFQLILHDIPLHEGCTILDYNIHQGTNLQMVLSHRMGCGNIKSFYLTEESKYNGDNNKKNSILKLISKAYDDDTALTQFWGIDRFPKKKDNEYRNIPLNTRILEKLSYFLNPCNSIGVLNKGLIILFHIAAIESQETKKVTSIYNGVTEQLSLLIVHEGQETINTVLQIYSTLINHKDSNTDPSVIKMLIHNGMDKDVIRKNYSRKNKQNCMLFNGFIRTECDICKVNIPNDIIHIIFGYFGNYNKLQLDLLQRLIDLLDGYNVKTNVLTLLYSITRYADDELIKKLVYDYNLLTHLREILVNDGNKIHLEWTCWIIQNIHLDMLHIYDIMEPFINVITKTNDYYVGIPVMYTLNNYIISQWCSADTLKDMIEKYQLIENWEAFMNCVFVGRIDDEKKYDSESDRPWDERSIKKEEIDLDENILTDAFGIIEYLLGYDEDNIRHLCYNKVNKFWKKLYKNINVHSQIQKVGNLYGKSATINFLLTIESIIESD